MKYINKVSSHHEIHEIHEIQNFISNFYNNGKKPSSYMQPTMFLKWNTTMFVLNLSLHLRLHVLKFSI